MLTSFFLRQLFNICKKKESNLLRLDNFLSIDVVSAVSSAFLFWYISLLDYKILMDDEKKDTIDYMVAAVLVLVWARLYMLFLVIPSISKMILTLGAMLLDVRPFMILISCYLIFSTQLFSTLFQDINEDFSSLFGSFQVVYNGIIGAYSYGGSGDKELLYSAITVLHLFFLFILLLNFMIAILSTTYGSMLESGSFKYKCSLYEYCERYMIAFEEENFGELVVHAPPLNILCLVMVPFSIIPASNVMSKVSHMYSLFIFWMENIIFVFAFFLFELMLVPLLYLVCMFNIIYSTNGMFTTVYNIIKWLLLGFLYLAFILMKDVWYLLRILSMHEGCKKANEKEEKSSEKEKKERSDKLDMQMTCYNQIRGIIIKMYTEIQN